MKHFMGTSKNSIKVPRCFLPLKTKVFRNFLISVNLFLFLIIPAWTVEIQTAIQTSNYGFSSGGSLQENKPLFGSMFKITDQIQSNLDGMIVYESDPVCGNILSARASYRTSYLEISAGPAFGVLNSKNDNSDVSFLLQPGLGIGFSITAPGILTAKADSAFALPPPSQNSEQVYVQQSKLSVGFYLPNALCSLAVSQRTNSETGSSQTVKSIFDYGFYTETFKKGSPFRIGINFIYRVCDYYENAGSDNNKKIANLVLGGSFTWVPTKELNFFVDGTGSLYTFSLKEKVPGLDVFLFDLKVGTSIQLKRPLK